MVNRGKKSNFKKIFFNQKFLSLVGLIVIILISFPFAKNAIKQYRINQEISGYGKEIAGLQDRSAYLKKMISYAESEQSVEDYARQNLNLKKAGEEKVVIEDVDNGLNSASSSGSGLLEEGSREGLSNPRKWLNYFLK